MGEISKKVLQAGFSGEEAKQLVLRLQAADDPRSAVEEMFDDLNFDLAELKDHVRAAGDNISVKEKSTEGVNLSSFPGNEKS